jgi:hypothetical protein
VSTQPSVEELAMKLAMLRAERPPFSQRYTEAYRAHMHLEYVAQELLIGRVGLSGTGTLTAQARETLKMIGFA